MNARGILVGIPDHVDSGQWGLRVQSTHGTSLLTLLGVEEVESLELGVWDLCSVFMSCPVFTLPFLAVRGGICFRWGEQPFFIPPLGDRGSWKEMSMNYQRDLFRYYDAPDTHIPVIL